jgi:hypothetical protein
MMPLSRPGRRKLARWMLVFLMAMASSNPVLASPPGSIDRFLDRKYGRSKLDALFDRNMPPNADGAGLEGRKADGSYWSRAAFAIGNIVVFDWPRRALADHCRKSVGNLVVRLPMCSMADW